MTDSEMALEPRPAKSGALGQLVNLFVAPGQALEYARDHAKMWWLPFGITLGLQLALFVWMALTINIQLLHAIMIQGLSRMDPDKAAQAAQMISQHGRGYFLMGMVIAVVVFGIGELVFALYLFLADKLFSAANRSYGQWFSFTAWTWLPFAIAAIVAGIVWALASHASAMPSDPTSLNALLFHFKQGDRGYGVAQFSLFEIWIIALVVYGLKRWCGHSTFKAIVIALIPYIVVYAIKYFL